MIVPKPSVSADGLFKQFDSCRICLMVLEVRDPKKMEKEKKRFDGSRI